VGSPGNRGKAWDADGGNPSNKRGRATLRGRTMAASSRVANETVVPGCWMHSDLFIPDIHVHRLFTVCSPSYSPPTSHNPAPLYFVLQSFPRCQNTLLFADVVVVAGLRLFIYCSIYQLDETRYQAACTQCIHPSHTHVTTTFFKSRTNHPYRYPSETVECHSIGRTRLFEVLILEDG
jgi:hypothetical protein